MKSRIAIYGGSFSPPSMGHLAVVELLRGMFDEVVIVLSGVRSDKPELSEIMGLHRVAMCELTFDGLGKVSLDAADVKRESYRPTFELMRQFTAQGKDAWCVVGSDLVIGGRAGKAAIHTWEQGEKLWTTAQFVVVERSQYPFDESDLPPQAIFLGYNATIQTSSGEIRRRIHADGSITGLVVPRVEAYIQQHKLYRGGDS